MYLVAGATGNIGGEVTRALLAAGEEVRALVRNDQSHVPEGARAVVGDLNRPDTLEPHLADVRGVFLLPGYDGLAKLLELAKAAGVARVVQLSGGSAASGDETNAVTRYMAATERAVTRSGLPWTILRPSAFATNSLEWADQLRAGDTVRAPFAGVRIAVIDPADIGAVAAVALTSGAHEGQMYHLSGPEATTPAERVAVLGEVLGRRLTFEAQPNDEARAAMEASMPREYVDAFFDFYVTGSLDESQVLPTVEQITGRPPRSFRDWATAHAAAFV
ncbi:Rossmann-fold NAD(P)-binding domain-containing protein [Flindersiella endophytica]